MNQVSGKVLLKETNIGIPDLLVEIYDIDPGTKPEEVVAGDGALTGIAVTRAASSSVSQANLLGDRLGSVLTDRAGFFKLDYEDADFRRRNSQEQRPDLLLMVRAPEEMDSLSNAKVLHVSKDIRQSAGATETYIIRISNQKLSAAGVSSPTGITLDAEEPDAVIQKVSLAITRQAKIRSEVQKIAAQQVAAQRQRVERVEREVESRLLETLTGVPDRLAERLNYVRPGGDMEAAMFSTIKKNIEGTINRASPAKGYLVLSESQAQSFRKEDGTFRDDIPHQELEPLLFGAAEDGQRPTFLIRESPLDLLRQAQGPAAIPPSPTAPSVGPNGAGSRAGGSNGGEAIGSAAASNVDSLAAVSPSQIPDFVGRLIETMTSPEEAVAFGVKPRATQDAIDGEISAFRLRSGPADVPAFYDFHSLQIALDYVWQKAIDEGVIESAKELSLQLIEMGGDPLGALRNSANPARALREELRTVQAALSAPNLNSVAARIKEESPKDDDDGTGGPGNTAPPPPTGGVKPPPNKDDERPPSPPELLSQLQGLLKERFAFEIFAPGSVNFGILVSYRQRWAPINYQVGDLIRTITLTPKETRKVNAKRVVKKDRSVKEMEDSLRVRKEESNVTSRDEAEIIAKAEVKTNFSLTAQGSFNIGIAKGDSTTVFGRDAVTNSSDTKKAFREAVIKAAQEFRNERKLEVETKETYEAEVTESAEITNPNDELPVTYLFYELQRRYKISETIHRLSPVVLVAMDVPNPGRREIDALLLTYGWIIDRVLLDDQFRKPLEYMRTKLVGEESALTALRANVTVMAGVVKELKKSYTQARDKTNVLGDLLTGQIVLKARATEAQESEGFWEKAVESVTGDDGASVEGARILEDAARERFERAVNREKELRAQLDSEAAALRSANDAYARALAEHLNCLMDIGSLRLHVKENILYYMQAIWSHTFRDQLFLTLHKKKVPRLTPREKRYRLSVPGGPPPSVPTKPGRVVVEVSAELRLESQLDPNEDFVTLAEVADLDNLLGFKGNYLIFPLRQSNALTDFMMTPYVDSELGLRDPDELGNFTPEEFAAYARALHAQMQGQLERGEITEAELAASVAQLSDQFRRLFSAPRRAEDEITVPTGSLYIEALPGAHPILEDFKLMHRAVDVKKVQAEVRRMEMENVRYAARILSNEREDPDIERKIVISGNGESIVVPPVDS